MSILTSTSTGISGVKVDADFLEKRGYTTKNGYTYRYYYKGDGHCYLTVSGKHFVRSVDGKVTQVEPVPFFERTFTLRKGGREVIKLDINTMYDLFLIEHYFSSKGEEHMKYYQKIIEKSREQGNYIKNVRY